MTCTKSQDRAEACLDTWINNIKPPHEYIFFGDRQQSIKMKRTWDCSPDQGEHRHRLPEKTYKMLCNSLNYQWDFLFKCDDDTFLNWENLLSFLNESKFKTYEPLYVGSPSEYQLIYEAKKLSYCWGDKLNSFKYAKGGAGYLLSRSSVKKIINQLMQIHENKDGHFRFRNKNVINGLFPDEDACVGVALNKESIKLKTEDRFFSLAPLKAKRDQGEVIQSMINKKRITTHYVEPETMRQIYRLCS